MRTPHRGLLALVLALLCWIGLACGLGDKLKEQASEEIFEQALDQAGVDGEVDVAVDEAVDVSDLPAWLAYPNAKATGKMTLAQEGTEGTMYVLETADPVATVTEWYKTALATWQQTASFESAEGTQLVYTDGAGSSVHLTFATAEALTTISCWYAKAAEPVAAEKPEAEKRFPRAGKGPGGPQRKMGPGRGPKGKKAGR